MEMLRSIHGEKCLVLLSKIWFITLYHSLPTRSTFQSHSVSFTLFYLPCIVAKFHPFLSVGKIYFLNFLMEKLSRAEANGRCWCCYHCQPLFGAVKSWKATTPILHTFSPHYIIEGLLLGPAWGPVRTNMEIVGLNSCNYCEENPRADFQNCIRLRPMMMTCVCSIRYSNTCWQPILESTHSINANLKALQTRKARAWRQQQQQFEPWKNAKTSSALRWFF